MIDLDSNAKAIFYEAIDRASPDERSAYLNEACGQDLQLRARVDDLLRAHRDAGNFLGGDSSADGTIEHSPIAERPGTTIGPYKLMQQIGEGGFGVVFLAEQERPVRRRVALKVIKPGMDTCDVIARFEAERQALAMMDHPNIARVFDAGATEFGRPYFVMELVRGVPITDFCDQHHHTPRQRLELFNSVCSAIQHAHQKGIIHRDVKPSNVLVALHDNKPVVKVIDFGVAKALSQQLTDRTIFTQFSQVLGTPLYMSPEQAELSRLDIDTRSDIYSLGVLLYELLAGTTPFDRDRLKRAALDEIRRIIREEEPPKPSTRLTQSGDRLPSIAALRNIEPSKLTKLIRGDLDWIVMKCLEKDRMRRYETAASLTEDLQRYLDNEPVQARPPSFPYRFRKLAMRHRAAMVTSAIIFLSLIGGIIGTSWQAHRAAAAAKNAKNNEILAVQEAERARAAEAKAQELVTKNSEMRQLAESQRQIAEEQLARSEWLLYASQIASAQRAWETNDAADAWRNLVACRSDLRGWEYAYLYALFNQNQVTLKGHARWTCGVAFSPDGQRIVSVGSDGIKLSDAIGGQELFTQPAIFRATDNVAFSPDGTRFVSGGEDKTLKVWNTLNGQELLAIKGHAGEVTSVVFSLDGKQIVSSSRDKTLKVWDATSGQELRTLQGHTGPVFRVALSSNGERIVSLSGDKTIKVWDAASGMALLTLNGQTRAIYALAFSPDGTRIVSGDEDGTLKVWDAESGEELLALKGHAEEISNVAFRPDGKRFVSSGSFSDWTPRVWDVTSGQELLTLKGHTEFIKDVAFSQDGQRIASVSDDETIKVWNATKAQGPLILKGPVGGGGMLRVSFSHDGKQIVGCSEDNALKVWDATSGAELLTLEGHAGAKRVAYSPDGLRIVGGGDDKMLKVWDATIGQELLTLRGHAEPVYGVAFSLDGQRIASGSADKTLKVWDATTGRVLLTLKGHVGGVFDAAFSPNGQQIVSCSGTTSSTIRGDDTLNIWDASSGAVLLKLKGHTGGTYAVAYSPDGKRIASCGEDGTLKVWSAAGGQELITLKGHNMYVTNVGFSSDGQRIVSVGADGTCMVWDASHAPELPVPQPQP
jgi:WD40 repeat protein/serine/threonine protein kinase